MRGRRDKAQSQQAGKRSNAEVAKAYGEDAAFVKRDRHLLSIRELGNIFLKIPVLFFNPDLS